MATMKRALNDLSEWFGGFVQREDLMGKEFERNYEHTIEQAKINANANRRFFM